MGATCPDCCKPDPSPPETSHPLPPHLPIQTSASSFSPSINHHHIPIYSTDKALTKPPKTAKKSWRGCGKHIPSAMSGVPEAQWCACEPRVEVGGKSYPRAARAALPGASWLGGFMGGGGGGQGEKEQAGKDGL